MTTHQAAAVIREAIRDAAKEVGCKPSDAHDPPSANRAGIAARNLAIVASHKQGVSKDQLCEAFRRSWETVNNVLLQEARNDQSPSAGASNKNHEKANRKRPLRTPLRPMVLAAHQPDVGMGQAGTRQGNAADFAGKKLGDMPEATKTNS